ncbi:MAG: hypothetical protein J6V50_06375 [Clostridia bacterium]|nr:hypothetical protein [Clostridia bacterium]
MKKTNKITLSAILAALAAVFMITSFFPYLTYGIPALASLFVMVAVVEIGVKWGFATYIVAAVLVGILPGDPEAKLIFIAIFGYYPVLKSLLERKCNRIVEYVLKFSVFNLMILLSYGVLAGFFGIELGDMGEFGKYTAVILIATANFVFIIYDIMITRVSVWYSFRFHKIISRYLKK